MTTGGASHLIVAGLLRRGDRGLLVHRAPTRDWYPDCWDLPGGHIEHGEAARAALYRELDEELGIRAMLTEQPSARLDGPDYRMAVWLVDRWDGEPVNRSPAEHDAVAWVTAQEIKDLRCADARLPALCADLLATARG